MKPKVYVCSRARVAARPEMWRTFRDLGANIISTWIDEAGPSQTSYMPELWTRIVGEIAVCDRVIVFFKKEDLPVKGVLVEVGMAIAFNKPVYIFSPDIALGGEEGRDLIGSWMEHPLVKMYSGNNMSMHQHLMGWED